MKPTKRYAAPPAPICGACRCFTMNGVATYHRVVIARLCGNCDHDMKRAIGAVERELECEVSKAINTMIAKVA